MIRSRAINFDSYAITSDPPPPPQNSTKVITPPKKISNFKCPKSKHAAVEAFLSAVEYDIFKSCKPNPTTDNLTSQERTELSKWQKDILFNPDSKVVLRKQDKGNRFVVVDKEDDIKKAFTQINQSNFEYLDNAKTFRLLLTGRINGYVASKFQNLGTILLLIKMLVQVKIVHCIKPISLIFLQRYLFGFLLQIATQL